MRKIREPEAPFRLVWTDKFFLTNNDGSEHFEHPLRVLNKLKPYLRRHGWEKRGHSTWVKSMGHLNGDSYRLIINHPDWPGEVLIQLSPIGREDWYANHLNFNLFKLYERFVGSKEDSFEHPRFFVFWDNLETEYAQLLSTGHVFNLYGQLQKEDIVLSMLFDQDLVSNVDAVILSSSLLALTSNRYSPAEFIPFDVMDYFLGPSELSNKEKSVLFQQEYMPIDSLDDVENGYIVPYLSYCHEIPVVILERLQNAVHLPKKDFPDFLLRRSGYTVDSFSENESGVLLHICRSIKKREYKGMPEAGFLDIEKILGFRFIEQNVHYFGRSRSGLIYLDKEDNVWGYCSLI